MKFKRYKTIVFASCLCVIVIECVFQSRHKREMRIELIELEYSKNIVLIDCPFAFKSTSTVKWKPL